MHLFQFTSLQPCDTFWSICVARVELDLMLSAKVVFFFVGIAGVSRFLKTITKTVDIQDRRCMYEVCPSDLIYSVFSMSTAWSLQASLFSGVLG